MSQWDEASESIKKEAQEHPAEVREMAEELQSILTSLYPPSLTLMAALYTLAISGASTLAKLSPPPQK